MFIREVFKKTKDRKYTQHQLIESIRTPAGPRQRLVLNLGTINIAKEKWKDLANLIESILNNQERLFKEDAEVESLARKYTIKIKEKRLSRCGSNTTNNKAIENEDYEEVNLNSLHTSNSRSIGAEHVVLSQIEWYGLDKILKKLKFDKDQILLSKMLTISRLVHPSSERETARWINDTSGISELLGSQLKIYDNILHRTAIKLWENYKEIEKELSQVARKEFDLKETVILYDLTNTYFEGSKENSKIARHGGNSKERRNDRPLVTLSLVVDEEGFPKQSKIYEGNVSEPSTLSNILDELSKENEANLFTSSKTIVIDAGIASEDNIELIKSKKLKYVAVSRKQSYDEGLWDNIEEDEISLSGGKNKLKIKLSKSGNEQYLLCHSEAKEKKEGGILSRRMESFEKALKELDVKLSKKGTLKKYAKVMESIGRLKERYKVGNLYEIEVEEKDKKAIKISYSKNLTGKAKEEKLGNYVLRTNRQELSGEEISQIHRSLTRIEESFKAMKAIGLRPIHHKRDEPTSAHIHITVLGYHILSGILKKLRSAGINLTWQSIKNVLSTHRRETVTMNSRNNRVVDVRSCTDVTKEQYDIYNALGIKQTPLGKLKAKTAIKKNIDNSTTTMCSD